MNKQTGPNNQENKANSFHSLSQEPEDIHTLLIKIEHGHFILEKNALQD